MGPDHVPGERRRLRGHRRRPPPRDIAGHVSAVISGRQDKTCHTVDIQCDMPGAKDLCHPETVRVAASHQAEAEKIAAELAAIARSGMVLPGSITQRRTRCGRRNCGCHADPPRLHGPYWQWTRKIAAKTICRWLSADQHRDYQAWIDNDRRLRELLARLEALGAAALDADPRWERRPRTRPGQPPEPERQPPDRVDSDRLTCGHPSVQALFTQLTTKREDLSRRSSRFGEAYFHVLV